eukprot:6926688-Prymnesium_polylepis.1
MHGDAPLSATAGQSATFAWGSLTGSEPSALQCYALCTGERTAALHRLPPWRAFWTTGGTAAMPITSFKMPMQPPPNRVLVKQEGRVEVKQEGIESTQPLATLKRPVDDAAPSAIVDKKPRVDTPSSLTTHV